MIRIGFDIGGGIVIEGKRLIGANAIAGEWGHNPPPGTQPEEGAPLTCACGRTGCIETRLNGAALARDHRTVGPASPAPRSELT
jgi:fructokinase